jgi:predicted butyrate kinase (DUF1464 family)
MGGTSGPLGAQAVGALDGEVAFLAGSISKGFLFSGGAATIAGTPAAPAESLAAPTTLLGRLAWEAYVESAVKALAALSVTTPHAFEVLLSGRLARVPGVLDDFSRRLSVVNPRLPVRTTAGFATVATHAAQGAALIADGLAGGRAAAMVETLGIREASGTVLDHLYAITPAAARARLGIS